ncbi:LLM class flavin-dependent oxidoreductase [Humidisolicoccus flavus]|uniref:LLM class flavin-dependent oxidoreductase n=1 Tax=Humidisolicoccus flavus TaxID=3111414 RepID=UPI003252F2EA
MTKPPLRRVHFGAFYPNDHHHTLWSLSPKGSQIEFEAFRHFAQSAERGLFDFVFLAEANWLQEDKGSVIEHAILDKPDSLTTLAALAAETNSIGLAATIGTTFSDPFHVARGLATLQAISGDRAGWNVVTSHTGFGVGASTNFRPGRLVEHHERYVVAQAFLDEVFAYWSEATRGAGGFTNPSIIQAGGSVEGKELAARNANVIFAGRQTIENSRRFVTEMSERAAAHGRGELVIMPSTAFVLGTSTEDALERQKHWRELEMTPRVAQFLLTEAWGEGYEDYDVDGPIPANDPSPEHADRYAKGKVGGERDGQKLIAGWRAIAERDNLSVRELFSTVLARRDFVGTPASVAEDINHWVQSRAADGFVVNPSVVPSGIDEFVDQVIPELQERGVYRTEYSGSTLQGHLQETFAEETS